MLKAVIFSEQQQNIVLLPETWNEMHLPELEIMLQVLTQIIDCSSGMAKILAYRIQEQGIESLLPENWMHRLSVQDAVLELLPLVKHYTDANNLTKNPFPQLDIYKGPADYLDDMLCGDFEKADVMMNLFVQTQDLQYIREMARVLWKPTIAVSETAIKSFFEDLSPTILQLIYLWWNGCKQHLIALFPLVFGGESSEEQSEEVAVFTRVIHNGAGERNGTRAQIRNEIYIKEFLFDIQLQLEQQAALASQYGQ